MDVPHSTQHRLSRSVFSARIVLQRRGVSVCGASSCVVLSAFAGESAGAFDWGQHGAAQAVSGVESADQAAADGPWQADLVLQ